jgi:hypothetical protein
MRDRDPHIWPAKPDLSEVASTPRRSLDAILGGRFRTIAVRLACRPWRFRRLDFLKSVQAKRNDARQSPLTFVEHYQRGNSILAERQDLAFLAGVSSYPLSTLETHYRLVRAQSRHHLTARRLFGPTVSAKKAPRLKWEDSSRGVCGERTVLTIGLRCGSSMRQSCRLLTAARPTPRHSRLRAARRSRARGRRSC